MVSIAHILIALPVIIPFVFLAVDLFADKGV